MALESCWLAGGGSNWRRGYTPSCVLSGATTGPFHPKEIYVCVLPRVQRIWPIWKTFFIFLYLIRKKRKSENQPQEIEVVSVRTEINKKKKRRKREKPRNYKVFEKSKSKNLTGEKNPWKGSKFVWGTSRKFAVIRKNSRISKIIDNRAVESWRLDQSPYLSISRHTEIDESKNVLRY